MLILTPFLRKLILLRVATGRIWMHPHDWEAIRSATEKPGRGKTIRFMLLGLKWTLIPDPNVPRGRIRAEFTKISND